MTVEAERSERLKKALLAIEEMRRQLAAVHAERTEPIAVVGMGCRLPGGVAAPEEFWQLLCDGVDAVGEIPKERWDIQEYFDADPDAPGKMYCRAGAFCSNVAEFDPSFFGISPREAVAMDPQHRLLLETAWEALERAGEVRERTEGSPTGVFVGITTSDYAELLREHQTREAESAYFMTGNTLNAAAGRLAFTFGLTGPAVSIDTACSSSLVAVHLACASLRLGECRQALACGVNLMLSPQANLTLCRARMLAPDGRSKTFDARGDGYGRGEGCGAVLLKRLSDALADGNPIWAVIRASGTNQDGPSSGLTVPHGPSQQALMRKVLAEARLDPQQVGLVEAHGTGTSLGDPIEMESIAAVYAKGRSSAATLFVGSAKTNIGHLEAAAGIAGLMKTVLAVHHGRIPAHLHLETPSPYIPWSSLPLEVPRRTIAWPESSTPRRAALDSFGASGTNAHVVVEEPPAPAVRARGIERPAHLLVLSAKTTRALRELARRHAAHLRSHPEQPLGDICHTAAVGRGSFEHRFAAVGKTHAELAERLEAFANQAAEASGFCSRVASGARPRIGFLFTGQGAQSAGVGQELYRSQPVFAAALDRCAALFEPHSELPLLELLFGIGSDRLELTQYAQPALFAFEYALFCLWQSWGVRPDVVMGHSVGEYVAAVAASVMSLEDAFRVICRRGALMGQLPAGGGMLAILASESVVAALLSDAPELCIAGLNGPENTVVAGPRHALDALVPRLAAESVRHRPLRVSHAFHSALIEPALPAFRAALDGVTCSPPQIDLVSNLTGKITDAKLIDADYWLRHARAPVRFADGLAEMARAGVSLFLELGPRPVLSGLGRQLELAGAPRFIASLSSQRGETEYLLEALAQLYGAGVPVDFRGYDRPFGRRLVVLPTYPFQRERYWFEARTGTSPKPLPASHGDPATWFYGVQFQSEPRAPLTAQSQPRCFVLFVDRDARGRALTRHLHERGHELVTVYPGSAFARLSEDSYELAASDESGVARLFSALSTSLSARVHGVVFAWHGEIDDSDADPLAESGFLGCAPIADLVRALSAGASEAKLFLLADTGDGNAEECIPEQATFVGFGACIAREHPERWGGLLLGSSNPSAAELELLCHELEAPAGEDRVLVSGGVRRVGRLVREQVPAAAGLPHLQANATYLVTGGLGGLGSWLAEWLVDRGARHLLLVGRNPTNDAARATMARLGERCEVRVVALDVCSRAALESAFADAEQRGYPVRGVVHAAGVVQDATIHGLTRAQLRAALEPKVLGGRNLALLAQRQKLDFLLFFSSISGVVGSPGQANYAAANAYLDALARTQRGAQAVSFGPWAGAGMAARMDARLRERIAAEGIGFIDAATGLHALERILSSGRSHTLVWPVDWAAMAAHFGSDARMPFFEQLLPRADCAIVAQAGPTRFRLQLSAAPEYEQGNLLRTLVAAEMRRVLGYPAGAEIDPNRGLSELGMDSLMAVELRNRLQLELGERLPATLAFEHPSVNALSEHLRVQLSKAPKLVAPSGSAAASTPGADSADEPIAIIGMACSFPGGADTPEKFWELLKSGVDAVSEVPAERWNVDHFYDPAPGTPGKIMTRQGAFIADVARFDCAFFGIPPREAQAMDPQHRLLLQKSWEALENAAVPWSGLRESRTGVFVGIGQYDYALANARQGNPALIDAYAGTGNALCFAAGRVASVLGLQGPALAIDTACSSSLVALHEACKSLRSGECDLALAGGVQLMLSPETFIFLSMSRALSADGRCRPFDAAASGFGRGEGCGMVVLKPLSKALRDGDKIWAVIRGSALNHDGPSSGLTVPNGDAQRKLVEQALRAANVEPSQVSYLEAHGTGTALGDPIEVRALSQALCAARAAEAPLYLGSVKSNIGHLEAAAGIAGLFKVVLSLNARLIPASLHFENPSPHIDWEHVPIRVPVEPVAWDPAAGARIAGISSFGLSGTNAHVIVEEPPPSPARPQNDPERPLHLLTLSAKSVSALRALSARWAEHIETHPELSEADICFSAATGRAQQSERLIAPVTSRAEILSVLRGAALSSPPAQAMQSSVAATAAPRIAFLFTGQGAQYRGMSRELFATQPTFRRHLERSAELLAPHLDIGLTELLFGAAPSGEDPLDQTRYTQPALLAVECALSDLLGSWGVHPGAVAGHSVGEYAAAYAAGVLNLGDALCVVAKRAALMQSLPAAGGMLAILADGERVQALLESLHSKLEIAGVNGPKNTVVSGAHGELARLSAAAAAAGIETRSLRVSNAFHSRAMEPIFPELRALLSQVELSLPRLELPSNVSGLVEPAAFATPDYWLEQLRRPVQFERMIRTLHQSGYDFFIEVGPHPALISMARQSIDDARVTWQPTLRQRFSDWQRLGEVLMRLYTLGAPIDWLAFDADYRRERVRLPASVFEPRRLWLEAAPASVPAPLASAGLAPSSGPLAQLFEAGDLAGLRAELERDSAHLNGSAPETLRAFDALFSLQHRSTRERALSSMVFATEWQPASADTCRADPAGAGPGLWLVFADRGGLGEHLAERLRRRGDQCVLLSRAEQGPIVSLGPDAWQISAHDPEQLPELSAALRARLGSDEVRGIVSLWPLDEPESDFDAERIVAECVAHWFITRLADELAPSASRTLWWVTRRAQSVAGSANGPHSLLGAALWGLGRTLSMERPELWGGLVDLGAANEPLEFSELCAILDAKPAEDQLAVRGRSRFVPRLVARPLELAPPLALGNRGAYVISGGLGALGRDAARWLASRGAQHLALFSRSAPDSAAQQAISAIESMGARVSVHHADVADPVALAAALAAVRDAAGGIAGVIHAAGVLGYQPLETLDRAAFQSVLAAKVAGGWNLHRLTQADELEFFVSYSSVSALWGSKGQAHYAAANAFLDGLSRLRAENGLPSTAIQWGPWAGGGMTRDDAAALYAGIGMRSLVPRASTELLGTLLAHGATEYAVADIEWSTFVPVLSGRRPRPFFDRVSEAPGAGPSELAGAASAAFLQRLEALPRDEQLEFLRSLVAAAAGKCLGMKAQELDPSRGFFALGMDSIMAVEMVEALRKETGLKLSYATLFEHVSVEQLAQHLWGILLPAPPVVPAVTDFIAADEANESARITAQVLELDDDELRSYINAEVDSILNGK